LASDAATEPGRSELRTRILSAVVLAPVVLAAVFAGGIAFSALVLAIAAVAMWEWTAMTSAGAPLAARLTAVVFVLIGVALVAAGNTALGVAAIALPAALAVAGGLASRPLGWIGVGMLYVGAPAVALVMLRAANPFGLVAVIYLIAVVWATDIAAYFGGRRFGGPKLWPRVSPKKTWSGALSGLVAALLAGGATFLAVQPGEALRGLVLAAPISAAAQAGDLLESAVKRRAGVKDSGHLIPGHGGVLDRLDGLFAAAVAAWLFGAAGLGGTVLSIVSTLGG
jgi:phosphatidate cytidylyltransferase